MQTAPQWWDDPNAVQAPWQMEGGGGSDPNFDLPPDRHARADRFLKLLDELSNQRQQANEPRGFLDRFAMNLHDNPIQSTHRPGTPLAAFLSGFVPRGAEGFSASRIASRGLARPDNSGRMAALGLAEKGAEAESRDNTAQLTRAATIATMRGKANKAGSVLDQTLGDADADSLGVPRGTSYRVAALHQAAQRIKNGANGGQASPLDPQVADMLGQMLLTTGQIGVPLGRNPVGAVNTIGKAAIAQNKGDQPNLGLAKADYGGNKTALGKLIGQKAAIESFSGAAKKNAGLLKQMIGNIPQTGATWTNMPARDLVKGFGSGAQAKYDAAVETVGKEYMRIITNPNLTGVVTDDDKKAGRAMIDRNATGEQIIQVLDFLDLERGNRFSSLSDEIGKLRGTMGAPAPADTAQRVVWKFGPDGKTLVRQ